MRACSLSIPRSQVGPGRNPRTLNQHRCANPLGTGRCPGFYRGPYSDVPRGCRGNPTVGLSGDRDS